MSNHYFKLDNIKMHCDDSYLHIECGGFMNSVAINNPYRSKKFIDFLEHPLSEEDFNFIKINNLSVDLCKTEDNTYELCIDSGNCARSIMFFENKEHLTKFIEWFKANCEKD